jgi:hypothetical protein
MRGDGLILGMAYRLRHPPPTPHLLERLKDADFWAEM